MVALGILFSLASTGLSLFSASRQSKATTMAARYENQLQQARATNLENEFIERATRQRINDRTARSQFAARLGRSGITSAGAPELILSRAAASQELAISDAARVANQQAADARHRGTLALYQAKQQKDATRLSMLGIGLQGAAQSYTQYTNLRYHGAL
jgi:hypothetical protein